MDRNDGADKQRLLLFRIQIQNKHAYHRRPEKSLSHMRQVFVRGKKNALGWPGVCELGVSCRADGAVSHTQLRTSVAHVMGFGGYTAKATSVRGLSASITLHWPFFFPCRRMA